MRGHINTYAWYTHTCQGFGSVKTHFIMADDNVNYYTKLETKKELKTVFKSGFQGRIIDCMPSRLCRVSCVPKECRFRILTHSVQFNSLVIQASTEIVTAYSHTTWLKRGLKRRSPCNVFPFINIWCKY